MDEEKLLREAAALIQAREDANDGFVDMSNARNRITRDEARELAYTIIALVRQADRERLEDLDHVMLPELPEEKRAELLAKLREAMGGMQGMVVPVNHLREEPAFPRIGRGLRMSSGELAPSEGEPGSVAYKRETEYGTNPCREIAHPRDADGLTIIAHPLGGIQFAGQSSPGSYGPSFLRSVTFEGCTHATIVFNDGAVKWATLSEGRVTVVDATKPEAE